MKPKYYVYTADIGRPGRLQSFTPQPGVRCGPYSLFGLRKALRRLRAMGYDTGRNAPSVYVSRVD